MVRNGRTLVVGAMLLLLALVSLTRFDLKSTSKDNIGVSDIATLKSTNNHASLCIPSGGVPPFYAHYSTSIWTLAPTTLTQLQSVMVLGLSLRNVSADLVLLESSATPLRDLERERLVQVGWKRHCRVPPLLPQTTNDTAATAHHPYHTMPHLWGMSDYERIIYMAPDTLLVSGSNMDGILNMNMQNGSIGATSSSVELKSDTFDPSVLVLRPDKVEYTRLLQMATRAATETTPKIEHDFLNEAYANKWQEIGFQYNANVSVYRTQRSVWDTYNISIIRYSDPKPFDCPDDDVTICEPWLKVYRELHANDSSPCLNLDFQPVKKNAIFTLNTGFSKLTKDYVYGSVMLGLSARQHSTIPFDLVHMEQLSKQISEEHWGLLTSAGWKQGVVDRTGPPRNPVNMPQYLDQFTKLHTWQMEMYDSLVYMDSDIWVIGALDGLLSMDLDGNRIAAVRDYIVDSTRNGFVDTFNMGVFKINPNRTEYYRLMQIRNADTVEYEVSLSEQGWINRVYNSSWKELSYRYNANMIAVRNHAIKESEVSVLHGTLPKFHYSCKERRFRVALPYCNAWKAEIGKYVARFQAGLLINGTQRVL
jgi:lipopolysaccharide biosynthesis glycosyltransferase